MYEYIFSNYFRDKGGMLRGGGREMRHFFCSSRMEMGMRKRRGAGCCGCVMLTVVDED